MTNKRSTDIEARLKRLAPSLEVSVSTKDSEYLITLSHQNGKSMTFTSPSIFDKPKWLIGRIKHFANNGTMKGY